LCIQVVRINFAHIKVILKKFLTKFYISKLCIKVVYISYDSFRNENLLEEKLNECLEVGVDRSLASNLATGR
jgi:hypothetical protein